MVRCGALRRAAHKNCIAGKGREIRVKIRKRNQKRRAYWKQEHLVCQQVLLFSSTYSRISNQKWKHVLNAQVYSKRHIHNSANELQLMMRYIAKTATKLAVIDDENLSSDADDVVQLLSTDEVVPAEHARKSLLLQRGCLSKARRVPVVGGS
jgi:hypothetical protein